MRPIIVAVAGEGLPPMSIYTIDENGENNS